MKTMAILRKKTTAEVVEVPVAAAPKAGKKIINKPAKKAEETTATDNSALVGTNIFLPLANIAQHPSIPNRRLEHDKEIFEKSAAELESSITVSGLLNPIALLADGGNFFVTAGFTRLQAITQIAAAKPKVFNRLFPNGVPCRVVASDLQTAAALNLVENLNRTDISPQVVYSTIVSLRDEQGMDEKAIAKASTRSTGSVRQYLTIADDAIDAVRDLFLTGKMTLENACALAKKSASEQEKALNPEPEPVDDGDAGEGEGATVVETPAAAAAKTKPSAAELKKLAAEFQNKAVGLYRSSPTAAASEKGVFGVEHLLYALVIGMQVATGEMPLNGVEKALGGVKAKLKKISGVA